MKIAKNKKILISVGLATIAICLSFAVSLFIGTDVALAVETEFPVSAGVAQSYVKGDTLRLPKVAINADGKNVMANEITLKFPDGYYYKTDIGGNHAEFVLSQSGEYTVTYSVISMNRKYSAKKTFAVMDNLHSTQIEGSYVEYQESSKYYGNPSGLLVSLKKNDVFTYNRIINLTELGKGKSFLELFPITEHAPNRDYVETCVTLTDIYDPDNFVKIYTRNPNVNDGGDWEKMNSYTRAGAAGQALIGLEHKDDDYIVHKDSIYGRYLPMSFYGFYWEIGQKTMALSFDTETLRLYNDGSDQWVVDFDDPVYELSPWSGFTTGEVYLSISLNGQVAEDGKIFLKTIADHDISSAYYVDVAGPKLTVDTDYGHLPDGKVGAKYHVPEVSVESPYSGEIKTSVKVFYNYGNDNQVQFEIADNFFKPIKAGEYTLIYTAKDIWGSKSEKIYRINVKDDVPEIALNISDSGKVLTALAGHEYEVAEYYVGGGTGKLSSCITAYNLNDGSAYDIKDGKFIPLSTGKYKIEYSVNDYISEKTSYYMITVSTDNKSVILDNPMLPKYVIKGMPFEVPSLNAYNFSTGRAKAENCEIYVSENGTERKITGNVVSSTANAESVGIVYKSNGARKEYVVPMISVGYENNATNMTKYFVGNGFTTAIDGQKITFSSTGNAEYAFINPVITSQIQLDYSFVQSNADFDRINVYFTDSVDSSVEVKLTVKKDGNYLKYSINGGNEIAKMAFTEEKQTLKFLSSGALTPFGERASYVMNTVSGDAFTGFPSKKAYIRFEIKGNSVDFNLYRINDQTLYNSKYDNGKPQIFITTDYYGTKGKDETFKFSVPVVCDVLNTYVSASLTVIAPDGSAVVAKDGTTLRNADAMREYEFDLNQYGVYSCIYNMEDSAENDYQGRFVIRVVDDIAPVITLSSESTVRGRVGTVVELPTATATDNVDGNVAVRIEVTTPNYRTLLLEEGDSAVVANYAGRYRITYFAYDKEGNLAIKTIYMVVE